MWHQNYMSFLSTLTHEKMALLLVTGAKAVSKLTAAGSTCVVDYEEQAIPTSK
jgi:hypothetical protein